MNVIKYLLNRLILILGASLLLVTITLAQTQDQQELQLANEYYTQGEKQKAFLIYNTLAKNPANIPLIHNNYFALLLAMGKYKVAEDYVEKILKRENRLQYQVDLGIIYVASSDEAKANKYFTNLFKQNTADAFRMKAIAEHLASANVLAYSVEALQMARDRNGNPGLFALELANLYRLLGRREEMVNEYLNYILQTPSNLSYVKNLLQLLLTRPEDFKAMETVLYQRLEQDPQAEILTDLLIWVNLQQKNFYGAFVQAKAFDRRFRREQSKTLEIGQVALSNKDYDNAIRCFSFVAQESFPPDQQLTARLGVIKAREAKIKRSYPVKTDSVRYIISEYQVLIQKFPASQLVDECYINEAKLYAYELDLADSATTILNRLLKKTTNAYLVAEAKLNLGDIYLLKSTPWESTLLYSQVEKSQRDAPLGYEAKLRNAKLWYYAGDFLLAQEHLDILKQATSREIANDAMELSMRIKENIAFDSTASALKELAGIELLVFQNKIAAAVDRLEKFKPDPNTPGIQDDVYWLQANLLMKQGNFSGALALLKKIDEKFPNDVLADDAYFLQGDIYEHQLADKQKAMDIYRDFITRFPGSVYAAEARKRFRQLRGDFDEKPNQ